MKAIVALPLRVNPFIKLCRWAFLISGIGYGIVNHQKYSIIAANFREEEKKMKLIREAQFAYEETLRNQETARDLAEALTGLKVRFERPESNNNNQNSTDDFTLIDESTSKNSFIDKSTQTDDFTLVDNSTSENGLIDKSTSKDDLIRTDEFTSKEDVK